jgi:hypothetical protein
MNQWEDLRKIYVDHPLDNGDAIVVTDAKVVVQFDALGDRWDPALRRNVAFVLKHMEVKEVLLAVARPEADLLPQDHAMWADLREELLGTSITVHPPHGLPAAA